MELQAYECKNCGAELDIIKSENGIVQCKSCRSVFTIPKKEVSPVALSFLRQGEHDLDTGKFDDAYSAFSKAAEYDKSEPEAYWGMALAEFKVRYIKDIVNNRLQPICYEFTAKEFVKNRNYIAAVNCATQKQKIIYESKAQEIDYIRSAFLQLKQSELDYDCFICVKVSRLDAEQNDKTKKNWTEDAYNADAIYDLLKRSGYTPFFSEREIKGRTGADYEAMILYALYTSETMIVVCSNEEYLRTPWVQNEYSRFKALVQNREKENDSLTIVFNRNPIERLPGENHGKIQGIDYSRREADLEIVRFVESHTPLAKAKREEEKRKKEAQAEEIKKQIEAQKQAQKALEDKLKNLNSGAVSGAAPTVDSLLTRAKLELSEKNFVKGKEYFDKVLDSDPENASAWFGLMLVDYSSSSTEEFLRKIKETKNVNPIEYEYLFKLSENKNYRFSRRWADEALSQKLDAIDRACLDRITELINIDKVDPNAKLFFETVIEVDELNAKAWFDLMLMDYGCASGNEMLCKIKNTSNTGNTENFEYLFTLKENTNYINAKKYADKDLIKKLEEIAVAAHGKINELLKSESINLSANNFYKTVLKYIPTDTRAWYGLMLIENGCISYNELTGKIANTTNKREYEFLFELPKSENYLNAKKYASEALSKQLDNIAKSCGSRINELLKKSNICAEAKQFYSLVLNQPEMSGIDAWYAMMLLSFDCTTEKQLLELCENREFCAKFCGYGSSVNYYVSRLLECEDIKVKTHIQNIREMCGIKLTIFPKEDDRNILKKSCLTYKQNRSKRIHSFITCTFLAICAVVLYFLISPYVGSDADWVWNTKNIALVVIGGITLLTSLILASAFSDSVQWSDTKDKNFRWFLSILFPPIFVAVLLYIIVKNVYLLIIRFFKWFIGIIPHLILNCKIGRLNKELSELEKQLKAVQGEIYKSNG